MKEQLARIRRSVFQKLFKRSYFRMFVDEKGIPINDYGYVNGMYIGRQRSIVAVAEKGLDYWNKWCLGGVDEPILLSYDWERFPENAKNTPKNSTEARRLLLNCADWLLEHAVSHGDYLVWEYRYPSYYSTKPGWRSSQAQAMGIQLLIRAYELTKGSKYLNCAERSLRAFYVCVEDGGVTDKESSEGWWYDKFADPECKKPKALNGMMFALLGIYDFHQRENNNEARYLFDKGIVVLKNSLSKYDASHWSYYDRLGNLTSQHYHNIHIHQLSLLYGITGEAIFKEYYDKFKRYSLHSIMRWL